MYVENSTYTFTDVKYRQDMTIMFMTPSTKLLKCMANGLGVQALKPCPGVRVNLKQDSSDFCLLLHKK